MEKLTMKEVIKLADINTLREIYAKLLALRMEYLVHNRSQFHPEYFENFYHEALESVKKEKMTKVQLCNGIINQSLELMQIGFTKLHLLKLAGLDIE